MRALLPLLACFAVGLALRQSGRAPERLGEFANRWLIGVALPATILEIVPGLRLEPNHLFLVGSMLLVFVGAWAFAALAGLALGWSRERVGALTLLTGLGNCTFVGYPLIEALRGREALGLAVITDQFGLGPVLAIGGSLIAASYGSERPGASVALARMLAFPPFIALLVALAAGRAGGWPELLHAPLQLLGATMSPVALFWIGLRFRPDFSRALLGVAALGLTWKLLLAPLAALGIGLGLGVPEPILVVGVLQSAMAPMITGAVLAERNGLEPALVHTVLGFGVPLGFVTVPLWNMLLG